MKRGFLNSKKAKEPLYDNASKAETPAADPQRQSQLSGNDVTRTPTASRPKNLKPKDPVVGCMITDNITVNHPEQYRVFRIPSTKSREYSACILRASTWDTITGTQGFYTPPPPLDPANFVFTTRTPSMGVGLFAKHSVKANRMIFSERPLLVFPKGLPFYNRQRFSKEEAIKMHQSEFERILQLALGVMTKEDADAYTSLSNCLPECPQLYGISRTNSFDTSSDIEEENLEAGKFGYAAVGKLASRINHSCMSNVRVDIDVPTFSLRVIAERNIKAGDQLFYCYCQHNRSVKERRRQLATYGFVCQCQACVNATPESDKVREEMDDKIRKLIDDEAGLFANPQFSIRSLDPLLKLEEEIVKEGLDFGPLFSNLLWIILRGYREINSMAKEVEYINKFNKCRG